MNNFDYDNFDYSDFNVANQDSAGLFDMGADFEESYSEPLFPRFDDTGRVQA